MRETSGDNAQVHRLLPRDWLPVLHGIQRGQKWVQQTVLSLQAQPAETAVLRSTNGCEKAKRPPVVTERCLDIFYHLLHAKGLNIPLSWLESVCVWELRGENVSELVTVWSESPQITKTNLSVRGIDWVRNETAAEQKVCHVSCLWQHDI